MNTIQFPYIKERAYNAILWLLHQHSGRLNRLKLMKLVFFVDLEHLSRYGRPVIGGHYVAMEHGPVASEIYTDIKHCRDDMPFKAAYVYDIVATAPVDEEHLSESDIEILREINSKYGDMDRYAIRDLTHNFKSWRKNYPNDNSSHPLPYEDFFLDLPADRQDMLEIIRDRQDAWALLS